MKNFKPTTDMIESAKTLLMAMAYVETIAPTVKAYRKKCLDEVKGINRYDGSIVTDIELDYQLTDEDFQRYLTLTKKERDLAGFKVEDDDFCPLLVAEDMVRQAQSALCQSMALTTGITKDQIFNAPKAMENYKKYIDLTLRLLIPFVGTTEQIIAEVSL